MTDDKDKKSGFLPVGKIVGAHGVRGIVKVCSYGESLSDFKPGTAILLKNPEGWERTCTIESARPYKRGAVLFSLEGISNRTMAETLRGYEILIEKTNLPEPEEGAYYWSDIIGLSVFTTDGTHIGCVEAIIPTGSNDVYVVKDKDNEILIPALESVVVAIDLEQRIMRVALPEGL